MISIVRATVQCNGEPVERHFAVPGLSEAEAAEAVRRDQGGEVAIVGHLNPAGAANYFPARAHHV